MPNAELSPALLRAESLIRSIPDYPQPGIVFRDITPLLADAEALRANNGTFVVSALLEPPLQPGHTLRFMLDGIPQAAASAATSLQLNNVERGDHRLHVEVLSGERIIQRSEPVLFTVQRVNTSSPALRPPPPKPRPAP